MPTNPTIESTDLPLVVLIDNNSASSAEILAGALASTDRAQLIGETTFGTGTVLLPFGLPDGSSIRLAVERWLTPDEELIFDRGITPDEEVPLPPDGAPIEPDELRDLDPAALPSITDSQLLRALEILAGGQSNADRSDSPPGAGIGALRAKVACTVSSSAPRTSRSSSVEPALTPPSAS